MKEDAAVPDGLDELDTDGAKAVPCFLWGASFNDTAAKARKHLRRDIESNIEEGSLKFLAVFWHGRTSAYYTAFWLTHDSLAALEIGCSLDPHISDVCAVRRDPGTVSIDE